MSNPDQKEKILAEREVFKGNIFSVFERDIQLKPGKTVTWEVVKKKGTDSVAVVAVDKEKNVFLIEEYFGGINERGLNLPLGGMGDGEDPVYTADRELQEEVGMTGNLKKIAHFSITPGYTTQRTHLFLATDLQPSTLAGDEEHYFKTVKIPLKQAIEMCVSGEISEARTVAGLILAEKMLSK